MQTPHPTEIIVARELALGFKDQTILSNMTFTIHEGEFIGIVGPNGSGKSTFLKAILGLAKPLSGSLSVLGCECHGHPKIGYMPQMRSLTPIANLSGRAILEAVYQGTRYGLPFAQSTQRETIENVLSLVHATDYAHKPFGQLSGGERQRLSLALALLDKPAVLLLDEPLSNLDPHMQEVFMHLLTHIQQQLRVTILFTTHDLNPLLNVMSRVLVFAKGRAIIGAVNEVMTSATLSEWYGTNIEVIHLNQRLYVMSNGYHVLNENLPHHHGVHE